MVRATGLDKTGEQTPSSRRLAMARGAVAFEWVRVLYSVGNRKRAHIGPFFYLVRATGLEPARFWQWNLNPPSLPIPPCPLISAGCAAVCFPSGLPGYLNTNISHCQSDSFFFFRSLFCPFCPEKTACMGFYTVYLPFYP